MFGIFASPQSNVKVSSVKESLNCTFSIDKNLFKAILLFLYKLLLKLKLKSPSTGTLTGLALALTLALAQQERRMAFCNTEHVPKTLKLILKLKLMAIW